MRTTYCTQEKVNGERKNKRHSGVMIIRRRETEV